MVQPKVIILMQRLKSSAYFLPHMLRFHLMIKLL